MNDSQRKTKITIWLCLICFLGFGSLTLLLEFLESDRKTINRPLNLITSNIINFNEAKEIIQLQIKFSSLPQEHQQQLQEFINSLHETPENIKKLEKFLLTKSACYHSLKTVQRKRRSSNELSSVNNKKLKTLIEKTTKRLENSEFTETDIKPILTPLYSIISDKEQNIQASQRKNHSQLLRILSRLNKKRTPKNSPLIGLDKQLTSCGLSIEP